MEFRELANYYNLQVMITVNTYVTNTNSVILVILPLKTSICHVLVLCIETYVNSYICNTVDSLI